MSLYSRKPCGRCGRKWKVELELSNNTAKVDLKGATRIGIPTLA